MASYYDILGVPKNATQEQIKNGYREQIKFFHPDVFQGAPEVAQEKTLQLNKAYAILRDPSRRREYDLHLEFEEKKTQEAQSRKSPETEQESPASEADSQANGSPNDKKETDYRNSEQRNKIMAFRLVERYAVRSGMNVREYCLFCIAKTLQANGIEEQAARLMAKERVETQPDDVNLAFGLVFDYAVRNRMTISEYLAFCESQETQHQKEEPQEKAQEAHREEPSEAEQEASASKANSRASSSSNVSDKLFHLCSHCGSPVPIDAFFCRCGCCPSSDSPVYRRCPICGCFNPEIQHRCQCGYKFGPLNGSKAKTHHFKPVHYLAAILVVAVLAPSIISSVFFDNSNNTSTASAPSPSLSSGSSNDSNLYSAPTPSPSALQGKFVPLRPVNGRIFYENPASGERVAPLTIVTRGSNDYYVKLRYSASKVSCLEFYVRGGQTVDIDVPLGTFELVYATGSTWCGQNELFGSGTTYHKADDLFDFYDDGEYINGWTVELYLQSNGNLDTEIISADDF